MDDNKTEEQKLRDLTPEKDAKGGAGGGVPMPVLQKPPQTDPPFSDPPGARPKV
jgi:hypothetical protein